MDARWYTTKHTFMCLLQRITEFDWGCVMCTTYRYYTYRGDNILVTSCWHKLNENEYHISMTEGWDYGIHGHGTFCIKGWRSCTFSKVVYCPESYLNLFTSLSVITCNTDGIFIWMELILDHSVPTNEFNELDTFLCCSQRISGCRMINIPRSQIHISEKTNFQFILNAKIFPQH